MDNRHRAPDAQIEDEEDASLSLYELEPSPTAEQLSPDAMSDSYFPKLADNNPSAQPLRFLGFDLNTGGRRAESWLVSIQKYSTYPPALFVGLHFANTSLIPLATQSVQSSETFLLLTRPVYQSPSLEPILLTVPILAHVTSGIVLRCLRQSRRAWLYGAETRAQRREFRSWKIPSVQARLGYALLPLLGAHVLVNRLAPLYVEGGSSGVGLGFVAHGIARAPWSMNVGYAVFVGISVWHFVGGWARFMGLKGSARRDVSKATSANSEYQGSGPGSNKYGKLARRNARIVKGITVVGAGLWLAGGLGIIGRGGSGSGWEARNWDRIYRAIPILGAYLMA